MISYASYSNDFCINSFQYTSSTSICQTKSATPPNYKISQDSMAPLLSPTQISIALPPCVRPELPAGCLSGLPGGIELLRLLGLGPSAFGFHSSFTLQDGFPMLYLCSERCLRIRFSVLKFSSKEFLGNVAFKPVLAHALQTKKQRRKRAKKQRNI